MHFLKLLLKFFVNIKKLFMPDLLSSGLHKKITICYILFIYLFIYLYLTNNLINLQFVKKRETSYSQNDNCEAN